MSENTTEDEATKVIAEYNKNEALRKIAEATKSQKGRDLSSRLIKCAKFKVVGKLERNEAADKKQWVFKTSKDGFIEVEQGRALKITDNQGVDRVSTFLMSARRIKEYNRAAIAGKGGGLNPAIVIAEYKQNKR